MITEPVSALQMARADFEELKASSQGPGMAMMLPEIPCNMLPLETPSGEAVFLIKMIGEEATGEMAEMLGQEFPFPDGAHLIIEGESFRDGFAQVLNEKTLDQLKITLVIPEPVDPAIVEAVEAVPLPERQYAAARVMLTIGEEDFAHTASNRGPWQGAENWKRFPDGEAVSGSWSRVYGFRSSWVAYMIGRAFLDFHEIPYMVVCDEKDGEMGVVTDFETAEVTQDIARRALVEKMLLEKAVDEGDPLLVAFLSPTFEKDAH